MKSGLRAAFGLGDADTDIILHALLAGPIEAQQQRRWQPLQISRPGAPLGVEDLRAWAAQRLPDYMVPAAFVVLDALPLTPNGKLDRNGAARAGGDAAWRPAMSPPTHARRDPAVRAGREPARPASGSGLADNFFHLGGHSLLATRLAAQIRARLGRELPIRTIFDTPALGDLAHALRGLPQADRPCSRRAASGGSAALVRASAALVPAPARGREPELQHSGRGPAEGRAGRRGAGGGACTTWLARHESLRTLLLEEDGAPHQSIVPAPGALLRMVAESGATLEHDVAAAAAHGFDLAREIPFRATLFPLGAAEHVLLLVIHHSAADGWSVAPLLDDLSRAYAARRRGVAPGVAARRCSTPTTRSGSARCSAARTIRRARWRGRSRTGRRSWPICRPNCRCPPTVRGRSRRPMRAGTSAIAVPPALHARLPELAQRGRGDAVHAVAGRARRAAQQARRRHGHPARRAHRRTHRGRAGPVWSASSSIRWCCAPTPAAIRAFADLLARARAVCLDAYAHQDVPFERLVEMLDPPRAFGRQPLFQTMLVLQNNVRPALDWPGVDSCASIRRRAARSSTCRSVLPSRGTRWSTGGADGHAGIQRRPF